MIHPHYKLLGNCEKIEKKAGVTQQREKIVKK